MLCIYARWILFASLMNQIYDINHKTISMTGKYSKLYLRISINLFRMFGVFKWTSSEFLVFKKEKKNYTPTGEKENMCQTEVIFSLKRN